MRPLSFGQRPDLAARHDLAAGIGLVVGIDVAELRFGGEVRLRRLSSGDSTFESLQKMFGVSATSMRTLAAAAWIFGDPRAQGLMDEMAQARLRSQGAMVLAPARVH